MGGKLQSEKFLPQIHTKDPKPDVTLECSEELTHNFLKQGPMIIGSEKETEILKCTMIKQEQIFKDQVRELHRLYQVQKLLMADLKRKDSNTYTLTSPTLSEFAYSHQTGSESRRMEGANLFAGAFNFSAASKGNESQNPSFVGFPLIGKNISTVPNGACEGNHNSADVNKAMFSRQVIDLEQPPVDCHYDDSIHHPDEENNLQLTLGFVKPVQKMDGIRCHSRTEFDNPYHRRHEKEKQEPGCQEATHYRQNGCIWTESVNEQTDFEKNLMLRPNSSFLTSYNLSTTTEDKMSCTIQEKQNSSSTSSNGLSPRPSVPSFTASNTVASTNAQGWLGKIGDNTYSFPNGTINQEGNTSREVQMLRHNQYLDWKSQKPCSNQMDIMRSFSPLARSQYQYGTVLHDRRLEYSSSSPSGFEKDMCQRGSFEPKINQQLHSVKCKSSSIISSLGLQQNEIQENLGPTNSVGLSASQSHDGKARFENKQARLINLTLGLSNQTDHKVDVDLPSTSILTKRIGDSSDQKTWSATEDLYAGKTNMTDVHLIQGPKRRTQMNGFHFIEFLKPGPENMKTLSRIGEFGIKDLSSNSEDRLQLQSRDNFLEVSRFLSPSAVSKKRKYAEPEELGGEDGKHAPKRDVLDLNVSTTFRETPPTVANREEGTLGKIETEINGVHTDKKIETFKENIDAVYRSQRKRSVSVVSKKNSFSKEKSSASMQNHSSIFLIDASSPSRNGAKEDYEFKGRVLTAAKNVKPNGDLVLETNLPCEASQLPFCSSKKCIDVQPAASVPISDYHKNLECKQAVQCQSQVKAGTLRKEGKQAETCKSTACTEKNNIQNAEDVQLDKGASECSSADIEAAAHSLLDIRSGKSFVHSNREFSAQVLDWFVDAVVTSTSLREKTEHVLPSPKHCENAKEVDEVSTDPSKLVVCSPSSSNGLDFFESMTLMLQETAVDEESETIRKQEQEAHRRSPDTGAVRTPKRGKRKLDFQREILPSISSLSRQEIAEDMQRIGGRSAGNVGYSRRGVGRFSIKDEKWLVPLAGRRTRHAGGLCAKKSISKNSGFYEHEIRDFLNPPSWPRTSTCGKKLRRRGMRRPRAAAIVLPFSSCATNPS